jgi:hypothetical protein
LLASQEETTRNDNFSNDTYNPIAVPVAIPHMALKY